MTKRTRTQWQWPFIKVSLLCLAIGMVVGCGQKGPLYLPEPEPETTQIKPADSEQAMHERARLEQSLLNNQQLQLVQEEHAKR
ncbi:MAG: lipoprotein [Idiomarina sp.]|nr:lipoprotein [Idiomarina sp.]